MKLNILTELELHPFQQHHDVTNLNKSQDSILKLNRRTVLWTDDLNHFLHEFFCGNVNMEPTATVLHTCFKQLETQVTREQSWTKNRLITGYLCHHSMASCHITKCNLETYHHFCNFQHKWLTVTGVGNQNYSILAQLNVILLPHGPDGCFNVSYTNRVGRNRNPPKNDRRRQDATTNTMKLNWWRRHIGCRI